MLKNPLMKSIIALSVFLSFGALSAQDGYTCAGKQKVIESEIEYAKAHNNQYRIAGLNQALSDVVTYCTNSGLEKDYQDDIADKLDKVAERQDDLAEAKLKGDPDKILKREHKLREAQDELAEAKAKLERFYETLKAEQK